MNIIYLYQFVTVNIKISHEYPFSGNCELFRADGLTEKIDDSSRSSQFRESAEKSHTPVGNRTRIAWTSSPWPLSHARGVHLQHCIPGPSFTLVFLKKWVSIENTLMKNISVRNTGIGRSYRNGAHPAKRH